MNFEAIAQQILNQTHLAIAGENHRIVEIEFYYHNAEHPDPFTHCHPLQRTENRWYFHRRGQSYRGGTFKGVDLTFGDDRAYGGILLRSLEQPDGNIVNGSCNCVNYILQRTNYETVAELDAAIGDRNVRDRNLPLFLQPAEMPERSVFATARIGLSLKRVRSHSDMPAYLLQPYRYLTAPQKISKGKIYLVLALHRQGRSLDEIQQLTKYPKIKLQQYFQACARGREGIDITPYYGKTLTALDICQLYGIAQKSQNLSQISN
ncbi:MAG: hypothetical protein J7647_06880 [Cyanobacteria bacterium SBLK]|nr:hypothetical protein [Cyanobacteria bacterium SBLK]